MLYEVTIHSGTSFIISSTNSKKAKTEVCKKIRCKPSDYWNGISSMHAQKVKVDYPKAFYQSLIGDETLECFVGKDVILYDEHHGAATRIRKATVESIRYFMDEYTSIIIL